MVSKTFGLTFFLRKPKNYSKGPLPIYLRITVDAQRTELSTKRHCSEPDKWNSSAGRMSGTKEGVRSINSYLGCIAEQSI